MKKQLSRMLCLLLCAVMLLGILPVTQVHAAQPQDSQEISPAAVTENEYGNLYFETFADLQELASRSYDSWTYASYKGDASEFVISEDLTLPENLDVEFWPGLMVTVAEGVTFTTVGWLTVSEMTVNGTLACETLYVYDSLTVNGQIRCSVYVEMPYEATLAGADNITLTNEDAYVLRDCNASTAADLTAQLEAAAQYPAHRYDISLRDNITITAPLTIPANAAVGVFSGLTLTNGCTLYGTLSMFSPTTVSGKFVNGGHLKIYVNEYYKGSLASTGSYSGSGDIYVVITYVDATLDDVISGVDLNAFEIETIQYDWTKQVEYTLRYVGLSLKVPAKPHKIVNVVSGIHVYWNAVSGASKYGVWRSETGKDGTYKWIANPTVPHFTDTTAVSGKTYYYKITAVDGSGNHTDKSEAVGISFVSTPDISGRTNIAAGVKLDWKKITGATGYAIYRKSYSGTDAWARIATIEGSDTLTWTDTSVKNNNGEAYKYTIRALYGTTLSGCRNAGRTMVRLSSQYIKSIEAPDSNSVKLSWSTSSRVTGYEVRFMIGDQVYKTFTIGNYKTGVKTFTGLPAGQDYTVQVRAYKKVDGVGSFYSDWSTAKTVKI